MRAGGTGLVLVALWGGACEPAALRPGRLSAAWTGADTAQVSGSAMGAWCTRSRWIEVTLIRGDTGVGIALFPESLPAKGDYPIRPAGPDSIRRPRSTVAARWYTQQAIAGFRGESGTVTIETAGRRLTGRVSALLRAYDRADTLHFTATFAGVPVDQDPPRCPPAAAGDSV